LNVKYIKIKKVIYDGKRIVGPRPLMFKAMPLTVGMADSYIFKSSKFVQVKSSVINFLILKRIGFNNCLVYVCVKRKNTII